MLTGPKPTEVVVVFILVYPWSSGHCWLTIEINWSVHGESVEDLIRNIVISTLASLLVILRLY